MKPSKPLRLPSLKWSGWYLTGLKLAVGLLLVLLIVLFWLLRQDEADEQRSTLIADVLWLEQSIDFHLEGNVEQFQQLANDLMTAKGSTALFELRSKHLLNNNEDLQQLIWLDESARPVALFPSPELPRLGNQATGAPERQSRAIEMARKLGKTIFTDAYLAGEVQGSNQIEVYTPLFASGRYRGVLIGVYPLNSLLRSMVPWWFSEKYQVHIVDGNGRTLASKSTISDAALSESYSIPFDPPGFDLQLQVAPYRSNISVAQTMISALIVVLAAAVLLSLWIMRRHILLRLAAEQALRSEHAFRKAMEDSLTVGMRARNLAGQITYANPAYCRMVGYSVDELINAQPPVPTWAPEEAEKAQAFQSAVNEGRAPHAGVEFRFMRKDGSHFEALVHEAPLIDEEGRHSGWMASVVDVTARKDAEDLARAQQEKLQFTSRLITMGEMASSLAHELNQPLAAISSYNTGCLNKLETGRFTTDELKSALSKIGVQAQRAGRIIGHVHDFVRKSEPKRALCDLATIVGDSVGFIQPAAKLQNVRIVCQIAPQLPRLMADRVMIEQVLLNLMRNGIEAMSRTDGEHKCLNIELRQADDQMQIRVIDRGPGIAADVREKLFTPFFSTKAEGMGIGLNTCRSIIEFHHGRLWLEDNPDGGSIFSINLPIALP